MTTDILRTFRGCIVTVWLFLERTLFGSSDKMIVIYYDRVTGKWAHIDCSTVLRICLFIFHYHSSYCVIWYALPNWYVLFTPRKHTADLKVAAFLHSIEPFVMMTWSWMSVTDRKNHFTFIKKDFRRLLCKVSKNGCRDRAFDRLGSDSVSFLFLNIKMKYSRGEFLLSPECIQWKYTNNVMFSLLSDNILMSEEKQRILLLERVNRRTVSTTIWEHKTLFVDAPMCLINLIYVSDFTHEGRRKQAPQSKTGQFFIVSVGYVTPAPLGGSSIKE